MLENLTNRSSNHTLAFMLTGIGILLPIMLIYNGYQYLVFRGRYGLNKATLSRCFWYFVLSQH